ncbi:MAG: nucleotide exchange factor GrpE [Candidatus Nealsonbacteria bacterium CG_4_9_14_0_2_um_filter_37_38]|uniref:Protein GrpE n=1 Tax=Candidatus Nealsonbacteria bacterium CG_4_10_14_0_8_um_filter_37_14 TaxID=1974684 RepID=A0A2M7R5L1_9BACT|nr:MAG: nucleotide exchange factor GrpE [Candidatus Nealsonbacteria bacterium CG11_big_fil_rev_8_21_14_0_20_37_68]PIW92136.1 MAG: nucleotide exchange factor GrpE [Candidatus Nealsonbacteria bacterium CG_4_8_14_3_um_filter_37_23]PIY88586.1 MAG: nucleotide exchange factor GrpE [Candidatus Nealsonbacteria bacterium CG_4_10_14_0_8_um_filter_37_14]PJC51449.1 MAG: nucleotide exchange factor GrpE [Candidatus Nealsonbacteria bacterium CG_4_9_14_0_2_um_filter_37_38]
MEEEKQRESASAEASADKEKELNLEELKKKLEECQKLKEEYLAGWQRERADFLNYKKEEMERIGGILKYANAELILKILPILDNFEIAARQNPVRSLEKAGLNWQEKERINHVIQGFLQIKAQLQDFLKNQGVEEIKTVGEKFDPNFHEAVEEVEPPYTKIVENEKESKKVEPGIILEEIQKGYTLNGRVIRPAKVRVSK